MGADVTAIRRRALFALPVALPVAAVAAKVGVPAGWRATTPVFDSGWISVDLDSLYWTGTAWARAGHGLVRRNLHAANTDLKEMLMAKHADLKRQIIKAMNDRQGLTAQIKAFASAENIDIPPREGAADVAKPVTAQAAAPVGETSCGGGESRGPAGCENIGDRLCTGRQPSPPPPYDRDGVRQAADVAPGSHDTATQQVVV